MNKTFSSRFRFSALAALVIVIWTSAISASSAPAAPSALEILKKTRDKVAGLKSYSFIVHRFDLADQFVTKRNEDALKAYKPIIDKLSFLTRKKNDEVATKKDYKETITTGLFVKPFIIQINLDKSDFVPEFLQKGKILYRPDINPDEIFFKDPYIGIQIGKDVKSDSASAMISNWDYEMLELDCALANGGAATFAGTEKYNGKPAYMVDLTLKKSAAKWSMGTCIKKTDITKSAFEQLDRELGMMADRIDLHRSEPGHIRYWIDQATLLIVKKEVIFGKTTAVKYTITDIKLNNLKPDDLLKVKGK